MTLIICPIKKCQRLRNVLSNSVPSMTNTKETLRPIRECFLNSPIKECSSLPKETCTEEISQRDLQVPLENVFCNCKCASPKGLLPPIIAAWSPVFISLGGGIYFLKKSSSL